MCFRFAPGWDSKILAMHAALKRCGAAKPLISTYPGPISESILQNSKAAAANGRTGAAGSSMLSSGDNNGGGIRGGAGGGLAQHGTVIRVCNGSFTGGPNGGVFRFTSSIHDAKGRAVRVPFAAGENLRCRLVACFQARRASEWQHLRSATGQLHAAALFRHLDATQ